MTLRKSRTTQSERLRAFSLKSTMKVSEIKMIFVNNLMTIKLLHDQGMTYANT